MDSEEKLFKQMALSIVWGVIGILIMIILCLTIDSGCDHVQKTDQEAIKAGMVQITDSHGNILWTKPETK